MKSVEYPSSAILLDAVRRGVAGESGHARPFWPVPRRRGLFKTVSRHFKFKHKASAAIFRAPRKSFSDMALYRQALLLAFALLCIAVVANSDYSRKLLEQQQDGGFRAQLIHPIQHQNATRAEKIRRLVAKSHARVQWMIKRAQASDDGGDGVSTQDYVSPLSPDGGGYIMEITIGSPGQKFKAIADTGSDLVWVQSDPCSSCSGTVFHPTSSSTYKTISCSTSLCSQLPETTCGRSSSCEYLYQYGSGETSGVFAYDTVTLSTTSGGTQKFPKFAVGCGSENVGFDGFEGLVGLGQGPVSLTSQLASAIENKFSYCLVDINSPSASSPLYFGASAELKGSGIQSTPILPSNQYPTYYLLDVTGISVAGSSIGAPGTTIIDSGTTLTYVPDSLYSKIKSRFQSLITLPKADGSAVGLDLCYDTSKNKKYKFPALALKFDGATLSPSSSNYFLVVDDAGDTTCLAMGSADGLPVSIIGNVMQQGYHILYDRGSSKLSWVAATCESLKN